jgi:hypothetical protein
MPQSHVETPYANNINDGKDGVPEPINIEGKEQKEVDIKKVIKINSGIVK